MSVRQYIGARYVTKIYENTLDPSSAEWQASVNYEPLTMVTYNNGSYLSKKEVPASVGNPADNPTYWTQTGFYNGQITSLQNQINEIIENQNSLALRRFIFIGDSYAIGYNPDEVDTKGWVELIIEKLDLDVSQVKYAYASGYGFANATGTFLSLLQSINENNPDTITDIFVCGGINDNFVNTADLDNAIKDFLDYANLHYPNALVHIGYIGGSTDLAIHGAIYKTMQHYKDGCYHKNTAYINNSEHIMDWKTYLSSDGTHPLQTGYNRIAEYLINYIYTGSISVTVPPELIVNINQETPQKIIAVQLQQSNDEFNLLIVAKFAPDYGGVYCDSWQALTTIADTPIVGYGNNLIATTATFKREDGGQTDIYTRPVYIRLANNSLQYYVAENDLQTTYDHITQIQFETGEVTIPTNEL